MPRYLSVIAVAAALVMGGSGPARASPTGDPPVANPGAATDKRHSEVRLSAEALLVPPLEFHFPAGHADPGTIGRGRYGMGVTVLVAVDGTGRVVDAAGGPLQWYERRGRKWVPGAGPYSIEDVPEVERGREHDIGLLAQPDQGKEVTVPRVIHRVNPRYPEDARQHWAEGTVILEATIDESGTVAAVGVLSMEGDAEEFPSMGESAISAVRQWRYEPARKNGEPVKVFITIAIEFTLEESTSGGDSLD